MKIVALDLGKGNSVACVFDSESARHRFETVASTPAAVHDLLAAEGPDRVVMEVGPLAGWVCDLCRALGLEAQVADPTQEAWRWKNVKRKSDRDDVHRDHHCDACQNIRHQTAHRRTPPYAAQSEACSRDWKRRTGEYVPGVLSGWREPGSPGSRCDSVVRPDQNPC